MFLIVEALVSTGVLPVELHAGHYAGKEAKALPNLSKEAVEVAEKQNQGIGYKYPICKFVEVAEDEKLHLIETFHTEVRGALARAHPEARHGT